MHKLLPELDRLLDNYLIETIDSLHDCLSELKYNSELYCINQFVNICSEMIMVMQNDRSSILLVLAKATAKNNQATIKSCSSFLKIYYAGFIINLNLFIKTYQAIINYASNQNITILDSSILNKDLNKDLKQLQDLILSRVGAACCFFNIYDHPISFEWKQKLLNTILDLDQAEYTELVASINYNDQGQSYMQRNLLYPLIAE